LKKADSGICFCKDAFDEQILNGLFPDGAGRTDRNFNPKGMGAIRRAREISHDLRKTYVPLETVRQPRPNDVEETLELMRILP
jgi:hypothetical protein